MNKFNSSKLKISSNLYKYLEKVISTEGLKGAPTLITINFHDLSYSPDTGGYHPVEISIKESANKKWNILYITDFAYFGAELDKEVDFDFSENTFFSAYSQPIPIDHPSTKEFYKIWESNFLSYLSSGAFDEIKVS